MFIKLGILFFLAVASWQDDVKQIDQQIEDLKDLQGKLRSSAQRNTNNAMRWQFQSENYLDARRAWDRVAADKQKIQELQDQIDDLNAKKQNILQEHGGKKSS
ncbi:MAG: hypothetical protein K940chlam6_01290 [Chlamydiae bacterium]|nr:hypothetical protein [Chlamydiota bacterium]NGX46836.1 hypothetical protein [Chlamydiota bacterium]